MRLPGSVSNVKDTALCSERPLILLYIVTDISIGVFEISRDSQLDFRVTDCHRDNEAHQEPLQSNLDISRHSAIVPIKLSDILNASYLLQDSKQIAGLAHHPDARLEIQEDPIDSRTDAGEEGSPDIKALSECHAIRSRLGERADHVALQADIRSARVGE